MKTVLTLCLYLLLAVPACAQPAQVPQSAAQVELSFAPVVKKVAPAVVNIFTKQRVQVQSPISPFANDPVFRQFFGDQFGFDAPRERVVASLGSGVIVSADGTIVTANHVIKNSDEIHIVLTDKREFTAKLVKADARSDVAVLKIDPKGAALPFITLRDSDTLEVGDLVLAIGNPFGVGQTVTHGIVSAVARAARGVGDYSFFIQTDAAINPGNSGGALVDLKGQLVGINTAIYSTSGGSNGIGFAIPANMVKAVLAGRAQGTEVIRPRFGFSAQNVTAEIAQALGMENPRGALVKQIDPGSPAEKAGLKAGDVILAINGKSVADAHELQFREATSPIGVAQKFSLARGGKRLEISLAAEAAQAAKPQAARLKSGNPLSGVGVADITPEIAEQLGLKPETKGVVVVQTGGTLMLQPGDIILSVNGKEVVSVAQLETLLAAPSHRWSISFNRGGAIATLTVVR
jgi:serine protease Do